LYCVCDWSVAVVFWRDSPKRKAGNGSLEGGGGGDSRVYSGRIIFIYVFITVMDSSGDIYNIFIWFLECYLLYFIFQLN
jgi:hypothetical protein